METRKFSVCLAFLLLAVVSQYSEARQSAAAARRARDTKFDNYDEVLADAANDTDQNNDEPAGEEAEVNATILTAPATYNVTVGRSVRLECKIDVEGSVVNWLKDGRNLVVASYLIANQTKYTFDDKTSDLIVRSVSPADSGAYRCVVQQQWPAHVDHSLVVSESPKVVSITASDSGRPHEGSDLLLTCDVTGSPAPEIIWSVEERTAENTTVNRKLTEKDGEFSRNSVFMRNVKRERTGKYYCYAFNWMGSDTKGVVVVVLGKPRIHVHKTVVNSAINVEAVLQCSVHEEPPVSITWLKDGRRVVEGVSTAPGGAHSTLTVRPASDADFGTYTCQAECGAGRHSRGIELVQRPVLEELEADGAKLSWRLHSHLPLQQIQLQLRDVSGSEWVMEEVPLPAAARAEYALSHAAAPALAAGRYEAVLKARNAAGWSDPATTLLDIVEQEPLIQHASVYRGNEAAARPAGAALSTALMYLLVRML